MLVVRACRQLVRAGCLGLAEPLAHVDLSECWRIQLTNWAKLSAKFLTTGNTSIPNMRVRFEILQPALGSGEEISTGKLHRLHRC